MNCNGTEIIFIQFDKKKTLNRRCLYIQQSVKHTTCHSFDHHWIIMVSTEPKKKKKKKIFCFFFGPTFTTSPFPTTTTIFWYLPILITPIILFFQNGFSFFISFYCPISSGINHQHTHNSNNNKKEELLSIYSGGGTFFSHYLFRKKKKKFIKFDWKCHKLRMFPGFSPLPLYKKKIFLIDLVC